MKGEIILAFDIGLRRTGVASGQTLTLSAQPAGQLLIRNGRFNWREVDSLISKWQPSRIVIGDPKSDDPHLNKLINRFKSHIQKLHKLPIDEVDETLTSVAANAQLQQLGINHQRKIELRDQIAACLILESYFYNL